MMKNREVSGKFKRSAHNGLRVSTWKQPYTYRSNSHNGMSVRMVVSRFVEKKLERTSLRNLVTAVTETVLGISIFRSSPSSR
ncbi:hypothetical protein WG66_011876 [Moniliophthora roreri]|nr:hypothetical protein WG66_011876 [Moniliophthora roreri]